MIANGAEKSDVEVGISLFGPAILAHGSRTNINDVINAKTT